jgi:hypothetical protein
MGRDSLPDIGTGRDGTCCAIGRLYGSWIDLHQEECILFTEFVEGWTVEDAFPEVRKRPGSGDQG